MEEGHNHCCNHCGRSFWRQDHLTRHELSHGEAQFRCEQSPCGMTFHRRDVLMRHKQTHIQDNTKQRRRPRRGPIPHPKSSRVMSTLIMSEKTTTDTESSSEQSNTLQQPMSAALTSLAPAPSLNPFDFCLLHYTQVCARRSPFIHHDRLDGPDVSEEKRLAMAALGACAIPEYREESQLFFQKSRSMLHDGEGVHFGCIYHDNLISHPDCHHRLALDQFQTHLLLLEYAFWHTDRHTKQWAGQIANSHASITVPTSVRHIQNSQESKSRWGQWIHEEEVRRALWAFYYITRKAESYLPNFTSTLDVQQQVELPRSDVLFGASDEQSWALSMREMSNCGTTMSNVTLEAVLQSLQSYGSPQKQILVNLAPLARHVVLVALLEVFTHGASHLIHDSTVNGEVTSLVDPLLAKSLHLLRTLWYMPLGDLFTASPPRSVDIQNALLIDHIEVFVLSRTDSRHDITQGPSNLCAAAMIAMNVLTSIYENDLLEVVTKAPWLADAASKRFVFNLARTMVRWANSLDSEDLTRPATGSAEDTALIDRVQKLSMNNQELSNRQNDDSTDQFKSFSDDVKDMWSNVFRCPSARWCQS